MPLFAPYMTSAVREYFCVAGLDASGRLRAFAEVGGDATSVACVMRPLRQVLADACVTHIVIGHNHPHGNAMPSAADRHVTRRIAALVNLAGVTLDDHLIFASTRITSFAALGLLTR
ncbi:MAG: hypothetical protein HC774_02300 [Sphingomonadales bacterium]|nr:hypothetical protein [Sphingomonadales bacterium]